MVHEDAAKGIFNHHADDLGWAKRPTKTGHVAKQPLPWATKVRGELTRREATA